MSVPWPATIKFGSADVEADVKGAWEEWELGDGGLLQSGHSWARASLKSLAVVVALAIIVFNTFRYKVLFFATVAVDSSPRNSVSARFLTLFAAFSSSIKLEMLGVEAVEDDSTGVYIEAVDGGWIPVVIGDVEEISEFVWPDSLWSVACKHFVGNAPLEKQNVFCFSLSFSYMQLDLQLLFFVLFILMSVYVTVPTLLRKQHCSWDTPGGFSCPGALSQRSSEFTRSSQVASIVLQR